jgi:hypothetical protein
MEPAAKRRLGDIFVERRLITEYQLQEALDQQRDTGGKLGEILVELGFITRICLAGVISEQWAELGQSQTGHKAGESAARKAAVAGESVVDVALRERLEALTAELADRDRRIAQQEETIAALLSARSGPAAA